MFAPIKRLTFISIILSGLNLLPFRHFLFEINSSLGAYYLLVHSLSLIWLLLFFRQYSRCVLFSFTPALIGLISYYLQFTLSFLLPVTPGSNFSNDSGDRVSIYFANVCKKLGDSQKLDQQIADLNPDIVALVETDQQWIDRLPILEQYPHSINIPRPDLFGMALFSKLPFARPGLQTVGEDLPPVIIAPLKLLSGEEVLLFVLHAMPPVSDENYEKSWILLRRVAGIVRGDAREKIIVGDFNSTPFGRLYRGLRDNKLLPASAGSGLQRTWLVQNPLIRLKIDHMLLSRGLKVEHFEVQESIDSDHFPLFSRIWLPQSESRSSQFPPRSRTGELASGTG